MLFWLFSYHTWLFLIHVCPDQTRNQRDSWTKLPCTCIYFRNKNITNCWCLEVVKCKSNKNFTLHISTLSYAIYMSHFTHLWPARNHCHIYWRHRNPQRGTVKTFVCSLFQVLACIKQFCNGLHAVPTDSWAKHSKPKTSNNYHN